MDSPASQTTGSNWLDRREVAPADPTGFDLARLVRRGFALSKFKLPVLPEISSRLLELSSDADVSFKELAQLIEQDMVLAAEIIRLMQTPVYNRGLEITSIEQAVSRLGIGSLRDVVAEIALNSCIFSHSVYKTMMEQLRRHSAATAQIATRVCRVAGFTYDQAFLAGLFHDMGLATPLLLIAEAYPDDPPPLEEVWSELIWLHEPIIWHIARYWRLPEPLRAVIRHHHEVPDTAPDAIGSSIVCIADSLATESGLAHTPKGFKPREPEHGTAGVTSHEGLLLACDRLGLSKDEYKALLPDAVEIVAQIAGGGQEGIDESNDSRNDDTS